MPKLKLITWSGTATAGIAREGSADATKAVAATQGTFALAQSVGGLETDAAEVTTDALYLTMVLADLAKDLDAVDTALTAQGATATTTSGSTEANVRADIASLQAKLTALVAAGGTNQVLINNQASLDNAVGALDAVYGKDAVAKAAAGDFKTYSEVNATVTGSVNVGGATISAAMSLDAGNGYDFADDDGFDGRTTGSASLDSISIDLGAGGKITLDDNNIAHLVDADDDGTGDVSYTNTFGSLTVSGVMDINTKDTDAAYVAAVASKVTYVDNDTTATAGNIVFNKAVAATVQDVQWSAKVSMPVGNGAVSVAMDEEGGNSFSASATVSGIGLSFASALEAADKEAKLDRSNTIGLSYVMGNVSTSASWNSREDGDQWGISATFAEGATSITASTDEGSDWSISGAYALESGASIVGGVNYTEDAYVGVSFAF